MQDFSYERYQGLSAMQKRDPGASGTIEFNNMGEINVHCTTAAAESRTLAGPKQTGHIALVGLRTDGGDLTLTVKDSAGSTTYTLTLQDAGDFVKFESVDIGGVFKWVITASRGVATELNDVVIKHTMLLNADQIDQAFFIADKAYQLVAAYEIHAVAGDNASAVSLQITKDTGTDAPGAGTDLLTNNTNVGFDMKGTANTVQTGTLTATAASLILAAGNRLSADFAGTVTTLAGTVVTVVLRPIN